MKNVYIFYYWVAKAGKTTKDSCSEVMRETLMKRSEL